MPSVTLISKWADWLALKRIGDSERESAFLNLNGLCSHNSSSKAQTTLSPSNTMTFSRTFRPILMCIMVSAMLMLSMHHRLVIASSTSDVWGAAVDTSSLAFVSDIERATTTSQMKHMKRSTPRDGVYVKKDTWWSAQDAIESSQR